MDNVQQKDKVARAEQVCTAYPAPPYLTVLQGAVYYSSWLVRCPASTVYGTLQEEAADVPKCTIYSYSSLHLQVFASRAVGCRD